ncbi:MAG: uracil-DNA glycosylase [Flavobacteriales bacterium]|nr:uracil-DNA glycosylase [Flavobacteriales bacterium]
MQPKIEESWQQEMAAEFKQEYFQNLKRFLLDERKNHIIYPQGSNIFAAFDRTPFQKVKVVILGQDPYHGPNQAHGLSFSVKDGIRIPPSLKNIYKELKSDVGFEIPESGNLGDWADQGVLLLNAVLTVRAGQAGSHQKKGWENFTDAVIKKLGHDPKPKVFILWGSFARSKKQYIDAEKHLILEAPHPSPFSAHTGFMGCKHFSKANAFLKENGMDGIDWQL